MALLGISQLAEELRLPFRILPSGNTGLERRIILIVCAFLSCAGWVFAASLHRPVAVPELVNVSLIFGLVLVVFGYLLIWRHQRHFGSQGQYWLVVERYTLTIVNPDEQQSAEWRNLTRFVVKKMSAHRSITRSTSSNASRSTWLQLTPGREAARSRLSRMTSPRSCQAIAWSEHRSSAES